MERDQRQVRTRTRGRGLVLLAVGIAGLTGFAACAGGEDQGSSPLATEPTTTIPSMTTSTPTTAVQTRPTTSRRVTTSPRVTPRVTTSPGVTTSRAPVLRGGVPQVTASPPRGAVGTRIHVEGHGFTDEHWRAPGANLWLTGSPPGCALYAAASHTVRVTAGGHLSGDFVVPARGECRQSSVDGMDLTPGRYQIVFQCTACTVGEFQVVAS